MASSAGTAYRPRIADAELRVCLAAAGAAVPMAPSIHAPWPTICRLWSG
jgi:hypothetical protein